MSQQVLPQYAPMVNVNGTEMIPAAAIGGQTRDGKDEIITGAGNMVFDPSIGDNGMWVPVSEANPLETRVKELEERLGAAVENPAQWTLMDRIKRLESLFESGDAKVTLTGQIVQLSTDTKPTLGSTDRAYLVEQDTEALYYWDGADWVEVED